MRDAYIDGKKELAEREGSRTIDWLVKQNVDFEYILYAHNVDLKCIII